MTNIDALPFTGTKTRVIEEVQKEFISRGIEDKWQIEGIINSKKGSRSERVTLIERKPPDLNEWVNNWRMMRRAGLPVPLTLRKTPEGSILVTNFKAHGEEMYGKGMLLHLRELKEDGHVYTPSPVDRIFMEIMSTQFDSIKHQAEQLVSLANEHQVILPQDDAFELLVHPNGTWKLVITDLMKAKPATEEDIQNQTNESNVENILDILEPLARRLKTLT